MSDTETSDAQTTTSKPRKQRKLKYSKLRATKFTPAQEKTIERVRKLNGFDSWSHALRFIVDCHAGTRSPMGGA